MTVTKQIAADKIATFLRHEIALSELVAWAEEVMMTGDLSDADVRDVVARLGVADVRAFGLTWEDCEDLLKKLGFTARVEVVSA